MTSHSNLMTPERLREIRTRAGDARRDLDQCGATTYRTRTFVTDITELLAYCDALTRERDDEWRGRIEALAKLDEARAAILRLNDYIEGALR